ncbi:hypothetical protein FDE76_15565 [Clostridium botulinum]|uniref:Uncharacterized protein n=1 Tax=Clostridium botulinum (strain Eklund 17B / Type B) TaxID=935198 RepID=B2TM19_CLOBB|nr:hypothetical protein CLL_A1943 [Clostridium botulinum B str. Eklund 17B (NRP)]MBY6977100.1 hypothetical protein [Clostridium botulinum]MBY6999258.1 hypothetical protein [Clostridium botulinum]MCR1272661.1 hypothetical protein [Clostridium botulinum]NFD69969.1 hypothetical protein [Clostridium botulinum]
MVSLKRFKEKSAVVSNIVEDVVHELSVKNPYLAEDLENNYGELCSMILASCETWDCVLSDIEK